MSPFIAALKARAKNNTPLHVVAQGIFSATLKVPNYYYYDPILNLQKQALQNLPEDVLLNAMRALPQPQYNMLLDAMCQQ